MELYEDQMNVITISDDEDEGVLFTNPCDPSTKFPFHGWSSGVQGSTNLFTSDPIRSDLMQHVPLEHLQPSTSRTVPHYLTANHHEFTDMDVDDNSIMVNIDSVNLQDNWTTHGIDFQPSFGHGYDSNEVHCSTSEHSPDSPDSGFNSVASDDKSASDEDDETDCGVSPATVGLEEEVFNEGSTEHIRQTSSNNPLECTVLSDIGLEESILKFFEPPPPPPEKGRRESRRKHKENSDSETKQDNGHKSKFPGRPSESRSQSMELQLTSKIPEQIGSLLITPGGVPRKLDRRYKKLDMRCKNPTEMPSLLVNRPQKIVRHLCRKYAKTISIRSSENKPKTKEETKIRECLWEKCKDNKFPEKDAEEHIQYHLNCLADCWVPPNEVNRFSLNHCDDEDDDENSRDSMGLRSRQSNSEFGVESRNKRTRATRSNGETAANTSSNNNFFCLWKGCKAYGKPASHSQWVMNHILTTHLGLLSVKCIYNNCGARFCNELLLAKHVNKKHLVETNADNSLEGKNEVKSRSREESRPCCLCQCTCHTCISCANNFQLCDGKTNSHTSANSGSSTHPLLNSTIACFLDKPKCCKHRPWPDVVKAIGRRSYEKQRRLEERKKQMFARPPKMKTVATSDFVSNKVAIEMGYRYRTETLQKSRVDEVFHEVNGKKVFNAQLFQSQPSQITDRPPLKRRIEDPKEEIVVNKKVKAVRPRKYASSKLQEYEGQMWNLFRKYSHRIEKITLREKVPEPRPVGRPLGLKDSYEWGGSLFTYMPNAGYIEEPFDKNDSAEYCNLKEFTGDRSVIAIRKAWFEMPIKCTQVRFYGETGKSKYICSPRFGPYFQSSGY